MKDTSVLSLLENERKETRGALENIMKAIESGIFNTTTQTRMNELEKQLADIEDKIELEKYNEQKILTKEKVMAYLTNAILKKPKTLISYLCPHLHLTLYPIFAYAVLRVGVDDTISNHTHTLPVFVLLSYLP